MYNLPYPTDRITGPRFDGLPHRLPFAPPPLQLDPDMARALEPAMGLFLAELQDKVQLNPLRTFLFNQISANNFHNDDFPNALMTVLEYAELLTATANMRPEEAIARSAVETAAMLTALNVRRFPSLAQLVTDVQLQRNVDELVAKFNQIGQQIDQFQQYKQQQHVPVQQSWGGGHAQMPGYGHTHQAPAYGQPAPSWDHRGGQQQWGAPPGRAPMQQQWGGGQYAQSYGYQPRGNPMVSNMAAATARPVQQGPSYASQGFQGNWQSNQSSGTGFGPAANSQVMGGSLRPRPAEPVDEPNSLEFGPSKNPQFGFDKPVTHVAQPADSSDIPWNEPAPRQEETPMTNTSSDATQKSADEIRRSDGSILRPAHKSGWTKTYDKDMPYGLAYDANKEILYHCKHPNGTVSEVLMEIDDTNEYLKYEIDVELASKVRSERKADPSRVNWETLTDLPNMDEVMDERERRLSQMELEEGDKELFRQEPLLIMSAMTSASMEEARLGASLNVQDMFGEVPEGQPVSYLYYHCIPTLNKDKSLVQDMETLCRQTTFGAVVEKFLSVKDKLESLVWHRLNDELTALVNEIVCVELGLQGITIDSFVDDMLALIDDIAEHDGPAYAEKLRGEAQRVVRSICHVLTERMRDQYVQRLEYPVDKPDIVEDILVFGELNSVIEVPWMSGDLALKVSETGSAVMESRFPKLHKTIHDIFSRSDLLKRHAVRNHYIVTADNVRFKLHRSLLSDDFYLISKL